MDCGPVRPGGRTGVYREGRKPSELRRENCFGEMALFNHGVM